MRKHYAAVVTIAPLVVLAAVAPAAHADTTVGDTRITSITVSKATTAVGATLGTSVGVTLTATDDSGIDSVIGPKVVSPDGLVIRPTRNECTAQSATTVQCAYTFPLSPDGTDAQDLRNSSAGAWHFKAKAVAHDGDSHHLSPGAPLSVKRHTRLEAAQATPEPVDRGEKLTVTGSLRRANWDTNVYDGYAGTPVALQFRKSGTDTFKTVKTVTTDSAGKLRTTVTANTTGTWRWRFTANTIATGATSQGDRVVVR
ncbi:calcium-binding protein [Streptomyces sp. HUCO-GS316]|uniref:calcium-binding protein n=1 Tax=Streptomyces sp. HUCO-GS316 TaxID=2692198 RepID=UPI001369E5C5|nr:calcium-binding protein [Streptomyces sp. HUCO-GS316]MXM64905.1 calcium-binding protein [Streptomyces sp. HUCO-GS316]